MKKIHKLLVLCVGILMLFLVSCSINVGPVGPTWTITLTNNTAFPAEIWVGDAVNPGIQRAICPGGGFRQVPNIAPGAYLRIWWQGGWVQFGLGGPIALQINANWDFVLGGGGGWVVSER